MTDPAAAMRRDLQRPLDESMPEDAPAAAAADGHTAATVEVTAVTPSVTDVPTATVATETVVSAVDEPTVGDDAGEAAPVGEAVRPRRHRRRLLRAPAVAGRAALRAATATARGTRRATRAARRWARGPTGRLVLPAALVFTLIATATTTGAVLIPLAGPAVEAPPPPSGAPVPAAVPTSDPLPPLPTPGTEGFPGTGPDRLPADALRGWAQQMSARTGIPVVALQAYGYAELVLAETTPRCHLSWTTLAAIGQVESNHGRAGGATLQPDGRAWPPIIGLPLDGQGDRMLVRDTDQGLLDGDPVYDRAVGPMQFIPSTWRREQVDATGDGIADPHNIHDAALAAANYLCRNNRDLATPTGWWQAVLSYNNVTEYAQQVFDVADDYGRRSRG